MEKLRRGLMELAAPVRAVGIAMLVIVSLVSLASHIVPVEAQSSWIGFAIVAVGLWVGHEAHAGRLLRALAWLMALPVLGAVVLLLPIAIGGAADWIVPSDVHGVGRTMVLGMVLLGWGLHTIGRAIDRYATAFHDRLDRIEEHLGLHDEDGVE